MDDISNTIIANSEQAAFQDILDYSKAFSQKMTDLKLQISHKSVFVPTTSVSKAAARNLNSRQGIPLGAER